MAMAQVIRLRIGLLGFAGLVAPPALLAQRYAVKPIRVLFPYPGGSVPDSLGRQASQRVGEVLGRSLILG
jgi:tripartite-type tricarboxylate transporter receptor subunit TctC